MVQVGSFDLASTRDKRDTQRILVQVACACEKGDTQGLPVQVASPRGKEDTQKILVRVGSTSLGTDRVVDYGESY